MSTKTRSNAEYLRDMLLAAASLSEIPEDEITHDHRLGFAAKEVRAVGYLLKEEVLSMAEWAWSSAVQGREKFRPTQIEGRAQNLEVVAARVHGLINGDHEAIDLSREDVELLLREHPHKDVRIYAPARPRTRVIDTPDPTPEQSDYLTALSESLAKVTETAVALRDASNKVSRKALAGEAPGTCAEQARAFDEAAAALHSLVQEHEAHGLTQRDINHVLKQA